MVIIFKIQLLLFQNTGLFVCFDGITHTEQQ